MNSCEGIKITICKPSRRFERALSSKPKVKSQPERISRVNFNSGRLIEKIEELIDERSEYAI